MARAVRAAHPREEDQYRNDGITQSGQDEQQIEYRRKFFDYFLKQLASIGYLYNCSITQ